MKPVINRPTNARSGVRRFADHRARQAGRAVELPGADDVAAVGERHVDEMPLGRADFRVACRGWPRSIQASLAAAIRRR